MNYFKRLALFALEQRQLIVLLVFFASLTCSVVYSWGPPGIPD